MAAITYLAYDLMSGSMIDELPLTGVKWSQRLNAAGTFEGKLQLSDPRVQRLDWRDATRPARTALYVDVGGSLVWGGIIWARDYDATSRVLTVRGSEFWSYFASRVQARDYTSPPGTSNWPTNPADPLLVAAQLVLDAVAVPGSALAGLNVSYNGYGSASAYLASSTAVPQANYVSPSYPMSQLQTIDSMVSMLAMMAYGFGFDYAIDVAYSGGPGSQPVRTLTLSYPRRGRSASQTDFVVDVSGAVLQWSYTEDGTKAANRVWETATGSGGQATDASWSQATSAGYPLLEAIDSNSNLTTVSGSAPGPLLSALADAALARAAYPPAGLTVTVDMFGDPLVGDYLCGDDIRVVVPAQTAVGSVYDERFPNGSDSYWRIVAIDVTVPEQGIATARLTCDMPPLSFPVQAPL